MEGDPMVRAARRARQRQYGGRSQEVGRSVGDEFVMREKR